jgi:hypothetical protein
MLIFSNKNFLKFFLNFFLILILIIIIHAFDLNHYKIRYDACDERWADDSLWTNFFANTESTICKDIVVQGIRLPNGFITLLATAFANKNITCGEFGVCNPAKLNRNFMKCGFKLKTESDFNGTIFDCIGIEIIEDKILFNDINDYIENGYTIVAGEIKNENNTKIEINKFLIEEIIDRKYARGVDYRKNSLFLDYTVISDLEIFRIFDAKKIEDKKEKKNEKNKKNLDNDSIFESEGKEDNLEKDKEYLKSTNTSINYLDFDENLNKDSVIKMKDEI